MAYYGGPGFSSPYRSPYVLPNNNPYSNPYSYPSAYTNQGFYGGQPPLYPSNYPSNFGQQLNGGQLPVAQPAVASSRRLICMVLSVVAIVAVLGAIGAVIGIVVANQNDGGGTNPQPTQAPQPQPTQAPQPQPTQAPQPQPTQAPQPQPTQAPQPQPTQASQPSQIEGDILNTGICGTQPVLSRVIGGNPAQLGHWPWIGSLQLGGNHGCGASLLNQNWAITATHCFLDNAAEDPDLDTIRFGQINNAAPETGSITRSFTAHHHPSYSSDNAAGEYDISLLRLNSPVTYTDNIRPICLATLVEETARYSQCQAAGWGARQYSGDSGSDYPDVLEEVDLPLLANTNAICNLPSNMICAGQAAGVIDTCKGDSGGPLICKNSEDSAWHLVGIVSGGDGCAKPNAPGYYSRVTTFVNDQWIINTINSNGGP